MTDENSKSIDRLNDEAEIAADYLEGLLDIADYEGDIELGIRNDRPIIQIVSDESDDIKNLVGKDGEVITALQILTRLAVQQKTGERTMLIVDVDGYQNRRRVRLREETLDAIEEVKELKEPISLDPMNSFERKIVHDIVREEGLRTRSHGVEPKRYVTIYLTPAVRAELEKEEGEYSSDEDYDSDVNYEAGENYESGENYQPDSEAEYEKSDPSDEE